MHSLKLAPDFNLAGVVGDCRRKIACLTAGPITTSRLAYQRSMPLRPLGWIPRSRAPSSISPAAMAADAHTSAGYPSAAITVCDLDRPAVDFAAATFAAHEFTPSPSSVTCNSKGRLTYLVGSLLTDLPDITRQFLDFAARHLGPLRASS